LGDYDVDGRIRVEMDLKETGCEVWSGFRWIGIKASGKLMELRVPEKRPGNAWTTIGFSRTLVYGVISTVLT
jgi:hypothetical protein